MKHRILILLLIVSSVYTELLFAEIRYVSKSGTSTAPYTTWETASDSIQKCINVCNNGDTVVVANGVYKERLLINTNICLIGSSMDSTIVDSRGIVGIGSDSLTTVAVYAKFEMKNFSVIGYQGIIIYMRGNLYGMILTDMKLENASTAVGFYNGYNKAENLIIKRAKHGMASGDFFNTSTYDIKNNIVIIDKEDGLGYFQSGLGTLNLINNIILHIKSGVSTEPGILLWSPGKTFIKNNLIGGFQIKQYNDSEATDSIFIINNVIGYSKDNASFTVGAIDMVNGDKRIVKNNIIINAKKGINVEFVPKLQPDYNLYWNITQKYTGEVIGGENEIEADPMVVKDTLPTEEIKLDMHLQAFSPAIDKGDPSILDAHGTRSDIGMFGGPLGEIYSYLDLVPKEPKGLSVSADTSLITLSWRKNTEADFSFYKLFMDTVPGFAAGTETFISSLTDTFYTHLIVNGISNKYYYKLTSVDNQNNESGLSEETGIITSVKPDGTWQIISDCHLYENYPNPFNPGTIIPFRLKERGYVKLMIYDIKGELVKVIVNEEKEAGYHEVEFNVNVNPGSISILSSGIYLYRIEVIGKGNIPFYSNMKKMIYLK